MITISTSNLLPDACPSRAAGDQSTASPGGTAQKASWERHAVSGSAKSVKSRPMPPGLINREQGFFTLLAQGHNTRADSSMD